MKTVQIGGVPDEVEYGTQGEMFIDMSYGLPAQTQAALVDYIYDSLVDMGKLPKNSFGWRLQAVVFPEDYQ